MRHPERQSHTLILMWHNMSYRGSYLRDDSPSTGRAGRNPNVATTLPEAAASG